MRIRIPCHAYRDMVFSRLVEVVANYKCDCIALSGGIDTSVILLAAVSTGLKPRGYTAVYRRGLPKDIVYANYLSKALNIDIDYVYIDARDVEALVPRVIECIGRNRIDSHRDGGCIEIRNDIVFYSLLARARDDRCRCILVGSGGDELFAGYSFMLNLCEDELEKTIDRFISGRYSELDIARCIGVKAVAPFTDTLLVEIAKKIPLNCLRSEKMMGKEILREILAEKGLYIISSRAKTPAESGAGTLSICRSIYDNQ